MLGPIFAREWLTVPRRASHYVVRSAYLGFLWVLGLTVWQAVVGWDRTATMGDNARFGLLLFQVLTLVQLILIPFFAALSAASAVAQEKDRRTFVLLLLTDLRSYEIVLGKLLGSLLQIGLLLVGMVPVLVLILLLGGVALSQVGQATLVLATTALAAGSLGCLVAVWRDKTFQALALTVLFLVLYLCIVEGLPALPALLGRVPGIGDSASRLAVTQWQKWLGPYEAMLSVLEPQAEGQTGVAPAYGFSAVTVLFCVLLNAWAILRLRVWNPSGEPIMQRERPEDEEEKDRARAHAAPGQARPVWVNPILWREMRTRGYGRRPLLIKAAYLLVLGLVCYYALAPLWSSGPRPRPEFAAALGLVPVAILSLLLVGAQAVTAITSERDIGALDLLLVTDLTPKEFIFGKLGGICYNTMIFLLPPVILAAVYAALGLLASPPRNHQEFLAYKNAEALICVIGATVVILAFVVMLGVHVALRMDKSRLAVIYTLATVFFLSAGTLICIGIILINTRRFEAQWTSFILFLFAGIAGLYWVLSADRPSVALTLASWLCPVAVYYTVTNILVGKPGSVESTDPLMPFLVTAGAFGFAVAAMLVPLLSEFDVALGRTTAGGE
ncbi:MAG TPA: ABC transporter permease subunit [Gemmataceae bacterium]|nr:ABC transporter permease subunit [Gemmataceae bacterium]